MILFEKKFLQLGVHDILRLTLFLGHLATFILFQASFAALLGEFKSYFPNECFVTEVKYVLDGLVYVRTDHDCGADPKTEVLSSVRFNQ